MAQPNLLGDIELGFMYRNSAPGTANRLGTPANYADISSLDSRLATINSTVYTAAYLSKMTVNDKIAAVRAADDPTTI